MFGLLLVLATPCLSAGRKDCPGCGIGLLLPPLAIIAVPGATTLAWEIGADAFGHSIPVGGTYLSGGGGALAGFALGTLCAYPFFPEGGVGAFVIGGLLAGLPVGTMAGQYLFLRHSGSFSSADAEPRNGLRLGAMPLPGGGRFDLAYDF